jgi:ABC-type sugar transport system ATPase subunit
VTEPVLSIRGITKRFGGLVAVNNVSWDIYPGEVVALLGDNGAGKSTLVKCVAGVHQADEGEIYFEGRPHRFARPLDARREGIETIYQDLALANNLDVGANIFLGREIKKRYFSGLIKTLDDQRMLQESQATLDALEIHFPSLTQPIESLSGGQRQAVAIARAVYWDTKLMIMDEPTSNLGVPEQHKVLELIRRLRDQGVPVILITHTLPDVFAVSDRLMVMHRGRRVTEKTTADTSTEELVQYMVGARDDTTVQFGGPCAWSLDLAHPCRGPVDRPAAIVEKIEAAGRIDDARRSLLDPFVADLWDDHARFWQPRG